jgi:hypothetical protein
MHIVQPSVAPKASPSGGGSSAAPNGGSPDAGDALDEAWAVLSESIVIREQLDHACVEVKVAIDAIKQRLDRLAVKILEYDEADWHPADQLLRGESA